MSALTEADWKWARDVVSDFCQMYMSTLGKGWDHELNDGQVMHEIKARTPKGEELARTVIRNFPTGDTEKTTRVLSSIY